MTEKPVSVVIVHSEFFDGSGWRAVHDLLTANGHEVMVVQNPTVALPEAVAFTIRAIDAAMHKVILVGHSFGGAVITEAGNLDKVSSLVYIAGFAPDDGESAELLLASGPAAPEPILSQPQDGFLFADREKFPRTFAADIDAGLARFMANSQVPWSFEAFAARVKSPAWKSKRSHYLVVTDDQLIPAELQRRMAQRAGSEIVETRGSHGVHISKPEQVAKLIEKAALEYVAEVDGTSR